MKTVSFSIKECCPDSDPKVGDEVHGIVKSVDGDTVEMEIDEVYEPEGEEYEEDEMEDEKPSKTPKAVLLITAKPARK